MQKFSVKNTFILIMLFLLPFVQCEKNEEQYYWYLGEIAKGYPQCLIINELTHCNAVVKDISDNKILFGISEKTRLTSFILHLWFLKKKYSGTEQELSKEPLKNLSIVRQFKAMLYQNIYPNVEKGKKNNQELLNSIIDKRATKQTTSQQKLAEEANKNDKDLIKKDKELKTPEVNGTEEVDDDEFEEFKEQEKKDEKKEEKKQDELEEQNDLENAKFSLYGIIRDITRKTPIENIKVFAYKSINGAFAGSAQTDQSGKYILKIKESGSYKLYFKDLGNRYISRWYQDKNIMDEAIEVKLFESFPKTEIGAFLFRGAKVYGKVIDRTKLKNQELPNIEVKIYRENGSFIRKTNTSEEGEYEIENLPVTFTGASYKISFCDTSGYYQKKWFGDVYSFEEARTLYFSPEQSQKVDMYLDGAAAKISGLVTDESGKPFPKVIVYAYDQKQNFISSAVTDKNGNYELSRIPSNIRGTQYKLRFVTPEKTDKWYPAADNFKAALSLNTFPATSVIANMLIANNKGKLTGTITSDRFYIVEGFKKRFILPVPNVAVYLYNSKGIFIKSSTTNNKGKYIIDGIKIDPSIYYKVRFKDLSNTYPTIWYENAMNFASATPIYISQKFTEIHTVFRLEVGAIKGIVRNRIGLPLENAKVMLYDANDNFLKATFTKIDGSFTINSIPSTIEGILYKLNFQKIGEKELFYTANIRVTLGETVIVNAYSSK